ncbi:hypothetical protein [Paratissierella segnis]|uniref:Uncharacterized protein n=1 Tax=Paratissierella segnis TaxID=2763679 RepID=A0A926EYS5_9FIRM|nr:hypothetical protein [Paratissierella segnis]MBC8588759.1 hypothetical protein [Paratissierella segnis]
MNISTEDILKKKIQDAQEMVRDYEIFSKKVDDSEIADLFKDFAEECGFQASSLLETYKKKYGDR